MDSKILFTSVSVVNCSKQELEILYNTAKKFFLSNSNVDFVLFSDCAISISGVDVINVNLENNSTSYYALLKILSLNYINLDNYDYIFINDSDQMYVSCIDSKDLLTNELYILSHFYEIRTFDGISNWSKVLKIKDKNIKHTMGNFFGGPVKIIKELLNYCNDYWKMYKNYDYFFSQYPEEVLLMKFISEKNIKEKRLSAQIRFENPGFMTNINAFGDLLPNIGNFKLIHNTKINMKLAQKIYEKVIR